MKEFKLKNKNYILITIPILIGTLSLTGCKTVTIDVNTELEKQGYTNIYDNDDRYIKVNYNPDYKEVVFIDSDVLVKPVNIYNGLNEIKEYDNFNKAQEIISEIPEFDDTITDSNLLLEQQCDNISIYLQALQLINENNPLLKADLIKYAKNYEEYLYSYNRYNEAVLTYEAIVYQRMLDNNVDIVRSIDELEYLYDNQNRITTTDDYPILYSTLKDGENIKDMYMPLAYDLHRITCAKEHDKDDNTFYCKKLK